MPTDIKIHRVDRGLRSILSQALHARSARVGVYGARAANAHKKAGVSVGQLAARHELGIGVPKRSWLVDGLSSIQSQLADSSRRLSRRYLKGKLQLDQCTAQLGLFAAGSIKKRIAQGIAPPLSPITIARKGSSVPLIDTGQMRAAISSELISQAASKAINKAAKSATKAATKAAKKAKKQAIRQAKKAKKQAIQQAKRAVKKTSSATRRAVKKAVRSVTKRRRKSRSRRAKK